MIWDRRRHHRRGTERRSTEIPEPDDVVITAAVRAYLAAFDATIGDHGQETGQHAEARETALAGLQRLTPREAEVFALRARGVRRAQIAPRLGISRRTVDNHLSAVAVKLGTSDPYQLAKLARELGLTG